MSGTPRKVANRSALAHHAGMIEATTDDTLVLVSDRDLLAAFQRTDGAGAEARRLLAEIERRCLDI
jgi:hypothetical protein